jgi:hypothetical protein
MVRAQTRGKVSLRRVFTDPTCTKKGLCEDINHDEEILSTINQNKRKGFGEDSTLLKVSFKSALVAWTTTTTNV